MLFDSIVAWVGIKKAEKIMKYYKCLKQEIEDLEKEKK